MPKVTQIPAALLSEAGTPVQAGDILPIGGKDSGRQVKVMNIVPDPDDGGILVQENYLAAPDALGLQVRDEVVIVEMSKDEARAFMSFFKQEQAAASRATGPQPVHGADTRQFARPVFDALTEQDGK